MEVLRNESASIETETQQRPDLENAIASNAGKQDQCKEVSTIIDLANMTHSEINEAIQKSNDFNEYAIFQAVLESRNQRIANSMVGFLQDEGLSVANAMQILNLAKEKIEQSTFKTQPFTKR